MGIEHEQPSFQSAVPVLTIRRFLPSTSVHNSNLDHFSVVRPACHQSILWLDWYDSIVIRPALLGVTHHRDVRNERLRYHVMVTVRCNLFFCVVESC